MNGVIGIFVGGRGERMGGAVKGLLQAPRSTESLLERLLRESHAALPGAEIVLVGAGAAYERFGIAQLSDAPEGVGPLGGMHALLEHARARTAASAIALACDLPHLSRGLIRRILLENPDAAVVVPRRGDLYEPLLARYATAPALAQCERLLRERRYALQRLVASLSPIHELTLTAEEMLELRDWDTAEDVARDRG
jgi:molybdopterin-guanine dinucleotide biosynthesis protein A